MLVLLPILLVVLFISTYKLTESPRTWYDDGLFMQVSRNVAHFNIFGVQYAPGEFDRSIASFVTTGYPVTYPIALVFKLFGIGLLQARIPMVIFLILLVTESFLLAYKLFGYKEAIISTFLLASFAPLYGNGKIVLGEIPGLFFLVLFLLLLNQWEDGGYKDRLVGVFLGLAAGLTIVTKPIFILLIPAVLIVILWKRKKIHPDIGNILWALFSFLIPVFLYYLTYFGKEDSIFKVLAFYGNNYSSELGDIQNSIFANVWRFFKETTPVYFFSAMLVWLGFYWFRARQNKPIKLAESVAISFSILVGLAYLKTPGWYRYFFPGHVLALLFLPAAFLNVVGCVSQRLPKGKLLVSLSPIIFAAMIIFQFYQVGFNSWVAGDYHSTRSKELGNYFKNFDKNKSVFVYEAAETVTFLPNDNYYQFFHITGDRFLGDRQPLLAGVPDEVIIASKSMGIGRGYLSAYQLKTKLYRDLYYIFEKKK